MNRRLLLFERDFALQTTFTTPLDWVFAVNAKLFEMYAIATLEIQRTVVKSRRVVIICQSVEAVISPAPVPARAAHEQDSTQVSIDCKGLFLFG